MRFTKRFTRALIAACGSPRMLAAHSDLYDQTYRYRRLMMAGFAEPEEFLAEHDRLANLAVRRAQHERMRGPARPTSPRLSRTSTPRRGASLVHDAARR